MSADRWAVKLKCFQMQDVYCCCRCLKYQLLTAKTFCCLALAVIKKRGKKRAEHSFRFYVTAISFQQIFWEGCDVTIHQIVWPNDHYQKRLYKRSPGHKIQSNFTNSTVGRDALWLAQRGFFHTSCRDFWCENTFNAMGARWILQMKDNLNGNSDETTTDPSRPRNAALPTPSLWREYSQHEKSPSPVRRPRYHPAAPHRSTGVDWDDEKWR